MQDGCTSPKDRYQQSKSGREKAGDLVWVFSQRTPRAPHQQSELGSTLVPKATSGKGKWGYQLLCKHDTFCGGGEKPSPHLNTTRVLLVKMREIADRVDRRLTGSASDRAGLKRLPAPSASEFLWFSVTQRWSTYLKLWWPQYGRFFYT